MIRSLRVFCIVGALINSAASVFAACSWGLAPSSMNFGSISVYGSGASSSAPYTLNCDKKYESAAVKVMAGSSGSFAQRLAQATIGGTTYSVPYNLYSGGGTVWGDGTGGTYYALYFNPAGPKDSFSETIYGSVPTPTSVDVPPGTYTDTVPVYGMWSKTTIDIGPPSGATAQATMTVQIVVTSNCNIQSFSLDFGNYDPVGTNKTVDKDAPTSITVTCTLSVSANVQLGFGQNATASPRNMINSYGTKLMYDFFTDSAYTTKWNPSMSGGTSTGKNNPINGGIRIYGRIYKAQDVEATPYADAVTATVNY